MMSSGLSFREKWTPRLQSVTRIVIGLLVLRHGMEQVFGFPAAFTPVPTASHQPPVLALSASTAS